MKTMKKRCYGEYEYRGNVIRKTDNPHALRKWHIESGPLAFTGGLTGGFFKLAAAKHYIDGATDSAAERTSGQ
jgi:hypothetical protein